MDVKAKCDESTVDSHGDVVVAGHTFHIYVITGRLLVNNFKGEKINLVINKKLTGDLIETSSKPTSVSEEPRKDIANQCTTVTWEVNMPADKSLEITYKYKVYIWY